ncbi:MAG: hypothetical protein CHACPFDD_00697 [Phycisphaerae bacterium]|nr:hypothetical protein [Phycisphaerae bacterium]
MSSFDRDDLGADLSAYIDGELPAARMREVERLLEQSPSDRQTVRKLRDIAQRLGALPRQNAPLDVAESVLAALRAGGSRDGATLQRARTTDRARRLIWLARATAAAAVFVGGVFVGARLAPVFERETTTGLGRVGGAPLNAPEGRFAGGARDADREKSAPPADALHALGYVAEPATESTELRLGMPVSSTSAGGGAAIAGGEMPEIVVNVSPRTLDEFHGAVRFVNDVADAVREPDTSGKDAGVSKLSYEPAGMTQSLVLTVDAGQVFNVIDALDKTVQQNTNVAMNFAGSQARQIYQAAEAGAADESKLADELRAPSMEQGLAAGETTAGDRGIVAARRGVVAREAAADKKEAEPLSVARRLQAPTTLEERSGLDRPSPASAETARPAYSDVRMRDGDGQTDLAPTSAPRRSPGVAGRGRVAGRGGDELTRDAAEGVDDRTVANDYGAEPAREASIEEQVLQTLQKARAARNDWGQRGKQLGNQVLFRVQVAPPPRPATAPAPRRPRP